MSRRRKKPRDQPGARQSLTACVTNLLHAANRNPFASTCGEALHLRGARESYPWSAGAAATGSADPRRVARRRDSRLKGRCVVTTTSSAGAGGDKAQGNAS